MKKSQASVRGTGHLTGQDIARRAPVQRDPRRGRPRRVRNPADPRGRRPRATRRPAAHHAGRRRRVGSGPPVARGLPDPPGRHDHGPLVPWLGFLSIWRRTPPARMASTIDNHIRSSRRVRFPAIADQDPVRSRCPGAPNERDYGTLDRHCRREPLDRTLIWNQRHLMAVSARVRGLLNDAPAADRTLNQAAPQPPLPWRHRLRSFPGPAA